MGRVVCQMLNEAMSIKINEIVYRKISKGEKVITLSLGEGFFSLPEFKITEKLNMKGAHYVDSRGVLELRKKLSHHFSKTSSYAVNADNILITSGSKLGIFQCLKALLNAGDEVLLIEPTWLSYEAQCELANLSVTRIPQNIPLEEVDKFISKKTKGIILNNPNNPSGLIYPKDSVKKLKALCEKTGITLFLDEAYVDFIIPEYKSKDLDEIEDLNNHIVIVNSFSKSFGLSGWRVGYLITSADNIKKIVPYNQHLATCAPAILQYLLIENFEKLIDTCVPQAIQMTKRQSELGSMRKVLVLNVVSPEPLFIFY